MRNILQLSYSLANDHRFWVSCIYSFPWYWTTVKYQMTVHVLFVHIHNTQRPWVRNDFIQCTRRRSSCTMSRNYAISLRLELSVQVSSARLLLRWPFFFPADSGTKTDLLPSEETLRLGCDLPLFLRNLLVLFSLWSSDMADRWSISTRWWENVAYNLKLPVFRIALHRSVCSPEIISYNNLINFGMSCMRHCDAAFSKWFALSELLFVQFYGILFLHEGSITWCNNKGNNLFSK